MTFSVHFVNPFTNEDYPLSSVPAMASFRVRIDGAAPNAPVILTSNGFPQSQGVTDANGHFDLTTGLVGAMGSWDSVWTVGGSVVGQYHVNVVAPPSSTSTDIVLAGPGPAAPVDAVVPAVASSGLPMWVWLLAGGVALYFATRDS